MIAQPSAFCCNNCAVRTSFSSASRIPLGRFGTTDEVAQVVMMLVGNAYMTGQTVALSGGMSFN